MRGLRAAAPQGEGLHAREEDRVGGLRGADGAGEERGEEEEEGWEREVHRGLLGADCGFWRRSDLVSVVSNVEA